MDDEIVDRGSPSSLHHFAVGILETRDSKGDSRFHHGKSYRLGIGSRLNIDGACCAAAHRVTNAPIVFNPTIYFQNRVVSPGRITGHFSKMLPVVLVASSPHQYIDA